MQKQKFLKPEQVLLEAGLREQMMVADLGAGNGFFSLPSSVIVGDSGKVFVVDVLEEVLSKVASTARLQGRKNIRTIRYDLESFGELPIDGLSCDFVIIGKVLPQLKKHDNLVRETYRILKTGGTVLVIEWKKEHSSLGPSYDHRIDVEDAKGAFVKKGFKFKKLFEPDNFHYTLVLEK